MDSEIYFDDNGNLVLLKDGDRTLYIPALHVRIAYLALKSGTSWDKCSPMYPLTREQAGFIFAHYSGEG